MKTKRMPKGPMQAELRPPIGRLPESDDHFLELILDQALSLSHMEAGSVHPLVTDRDGVSNPLGGPLDVVASSGELLHFHDDHPDATWRRWLQQHQWRSVLLVPLRTRVRTVGVMALAAVHGRREVLAEERRRVMELSTRAATAIAYNSVVRASESDLPGLIENLGQLSPAHVMETLLDFLLTSALHYTESQVAVFLLADPEQNRLCAALVKARRDAHAQDLKIAVRARLEHIVDADLKHGAVLSSDEMFAGLAIQLSIPVEIEGRSFGSLTLFHSTAPALATVPARLARIANEAGALIQKTLRLRDIELIIFTDPLTGLYTRTYWRQRAEQELDRARRRHLPLAVLMLDLDYFKKVNDSFGHPAGDLVLCQVAEALRRSLRKHDVVARYGGEEFIILLTHANHEQAIMVADRLRAAINDLRLEVTEGVEIHITSSGGLACSDDGQMTVDDLIHRADAALYVAKREGRNRVCHNEEPRPPEASGDDRAEPGAAGRPVELLRAVVARLCHEVNNPAAVILGQAELALLRDQGQLDEPTEKTLNAIIEQVMRIGEVTRRIAQLDCYRIVDTPGMAMIELPSEPANAR